METVRIDGGGREYEAEENIVGFGSFQARAEGAGAGEKANEFESAIEFEMNSNLIISYLIVSGALY